MTQKNILFILIDDLGWRDLSIYGSTFYETPNLDRFAEQSMRFTDAYAASPICSPTRASIISGQCPARVGITNYIGGKPCYGKVIDAPYAQFLPLEVKSTATTLRAAGYQTWHLGKWNLGSEPYYPEHHGFDANVAGGSFGCPPYGYFSPYHIPSLEDGPDGEFLTDRLTDEAIKLIENRDSSRPFYMNMDYYAVHVPIAAKEEDIEYFRQKAEKLGLLWKNPYQIGEIFGTTHRQGQRILRRIIQSSPEYAAMIYNLDRNIGRLLDKLDECGLTDDTLVIFTSDNGGLATAESSPTCNYPLSEGKGWMYEGGTREPLLVRLPGVTEPGSLCSVPVYSPDFYPTFVEVAETTLPKDQLFDGSSLIPVLGGAQKMDREALYWHYPHYGNQGGGPGMSVRRGDYKLIHLFDDDRDELYNLREDISENHDLVQEMPELAAELREMLDRWAEDIEATAPAVNLEYDGFADERTRDQIVEISRFDLDTPLGVLLHNMEAKGILHEYLGEEKLNDGWFQVFNHQKGLCMVEGELPLEEIKARLTAIEVEEKAKQ